LEIVLWRTEIKGKRNNSALPEKVTSSGEQLLEKYVLLKVKVTSYNPHLRIQRACSFTEKRGCTVFE